MAWHLACIREPNGLGCWLTAMSEPQPPMEAKPSGGLRRRLRRAVPLASLELSEGRVLGGQDLGLFDLDAQQFDRGGEGFEFFVDKLELGFGDDPAAKPDR